MNPYASFAAQATDIAGTEHLVWEDNGRLFHARYDEQIGAWVDKAPVSDATGGTDLKIFAGNIIPVDSSDQPVYAPGLIAIWLKGSGNDSDAYAAIGRYNAQGELEWSDQVQLSLDSIADLDVDIALGQNGKLHKMSQKTLVSADPRKSEYSDNPNKFIEDSNSPDRHDTDIYNTPFRLVRTKDNELALVFNPKVGNSNKPEDRDYAVLKFNTDQPIPSYTNPDPRIQGFRRPPGQSGAIVKSQSEGQILLDSPLVGSGLQGEKKSTSSSFPASTSYEFKLDFGSWKESQGSTIPIPKVALDFLEKSKLELELSGSVSSKKVSTKKEDEPKPSIKYKLSAGLELEVTKKDVPTIVGETDVSFVLGATGSQSNKEDGRLSSLGSDFDLGIKYGKKLKFDYPKDGKSKGFLFSGSIGSSIGFTLGIEIDNKIKEGVNKEAPFDFVPFGAVLNVVGEGVRLASYISTAANKESFPGAIGFSTIEQLALAAIIGTQAVKLINTSVDAAQNETDFDTEKTLNLSIPTSLTGKAGVLKNTLSAAVSGTLEFKLAIPLTDKKDDKKDNKGVTTFTYGVNAKAQVVGISWSWGTSGSLTNEPDKEDSKKLQNISGQNLPANNITLTYNPYAGSSAIYQNSRQETLSTEPPKALLQSSSNGIAAVNITDKGSGYLQGGTGDFLVLAGSGNAVLRAYVIDGAITSIVVEKPGSYNTSDVALDFQTNGRQLQNGTRAQAKAIVSAETLTDLVNDSRPYLDNLTDSDGTVTTVATWIADGLNSGLSIDNPINQKDNHPTTRVLARRLSGNSWGSPELVWEGGINSDSVITVFADGSSETKLMAVWSHASAENIKYNQVDDAGKTLDAILDNDIYYSIYEKGAWQKGQRLISLPGTDNNLTIGRTKDNRLHLAWVNAEANNSNSQKQNIYSTFFDPNTRTWEIPKIVNPNVSTFQTDTKDVVVDLEGKSTLASISGINQFQIRPGYKLIRPNGQTYTFAIGDTISYNGNAPFIVNINEPVRYNPFRFTNTVTLGSANPVPSFATSTGIDKGQGIASLQVGEFDGKPTVYWSDYVDTPYFLSVLDDSPEVYFRLEEANASSPAFNYGSLGNNVQVSATYNGNMNFSQVGALSKDPDPAVEFRGIGALSLTVPDKYSVSYQDFSVEAWVKLTKDTKGGEGIITRGQPQSITATLPQATLTYSIAQQQGSDGKWAYVVTADSITVANKGKDIFPNTLRVTNFNVFDNIDGRKAKPVRDYTANAGDSFSLESGQSIRLTQTAQTIAFAGTVSVNGSQRFSIFPGQRVVLPNGQTFIQPGSNDTPVTVSLKAGDKLDIFNNPPSTITSSLQSLLTFTADGTSSLDNIAIANDKQVLAQGTGLNSRPFSDIPSDGNPHSKVASLQFNQTEDWYLATGTGGKIVLNSGSGEISSANLAPDKWHHVVGTYDSTAQKTKLYIDGQQVGEKDGQRFAPTNNNILVGNNLIGSLDEVAIYGKVLTLPDANSLQFDAEGKYPVNFDPNAPAGEITSHFSARDVDPNDAEQATFYSVFGGLNWNSATNFTAEEKIISTKPSLERAPIVDVVGVNGIQPDGVPDKHIKLDLYHNGVTNSPPGKTITKISVSGDGQTWSIGASGNGTNPIAVLQGGKLLNNRSTGAFQYTPLGTEEILDLYFGADKAVTDTAKYTVTLGYSDGTADKVLSPNALAKNGSVQVDSVVSVRAEILENEVKSLIEVNSGVIIQTSELSAGSSISAGKALLNKQPGIAIGHPYSQDGKGRVWVTPGRKEQLNALTNNPLDNDAVPPGGVLIVGKALDGIGHVLAVGDVNGDGFDDLIIGAPDADGGNGVIYVISGAILVPGKTINLDPGSLPSNGVHIIKGSTTSNAGFALDTGDVDGDGKSDIVIGAPFALNGQNQPVGEVHIVFGSGDFLNGKLTTTLGLSGGNNTLLFQGEADTQNLWSSQAGYSVAVVKPETVMYLDDKNSKKPRISVTPGQSKTQADILIGAPGYHQQVSFNKDGYLDEKSLREKPKPKDNKTQIDPKDNKTQIDKYLNLLSHVPNDGQEGGVKKLLNTGRAYAIFATSNISKNYREASAQFNEQKLTSGKAGAVFDGSPFEDEDTRLGERVASAGDLNGDGFVDIAISAPSAAGEAGLVFGFSGKGFNTKQKYKAVVDSALIIGGGNIFDHAGEVVQGLGNITNNQFDNLLVSAPKAGYAAGQSAVILGSDKLFPEVGSPSNMISLRPGASDGEVFYFNGTYPQDSSGFAVAKATDITGDGKNDILLTAPFAQQAYVAFGKPQLQQGGGIQLDRLASGQGVIIARPANNDGYYVANLGDVNGDGYDDIAVSGNTDSVLIEFGGSTQELLDDSSGTNRLEITGSSANQLKALLPLGDFNGDGFADSMIITTSGQLHFLPGSSQLNGTSKATVDLSKPDSQLPLLANLEVTRSAGDLNGDGYEDLVTFDIQHAIILYGGNGGLIPTISANLPSFAGKVLEAPFAMGGGIGDINGDGYDDLLIQNINGASILLGAQNLGQAVRQDSIPSYLASFQQTNSSPSVYEIGDFNGDGFGDFVVRDRFISGDSKQALRIVFGNANGKDFKSIQLQTFKPISQPLMSVSPAGDVNGDGLDDLIFADPDENNGTGYTYILFGQKDYRNLNGLTLADGKNFTTIYDSSGAIIYPGLLPNSVGFSIQGLPKSLSGRTVSGGGDINGDGLSDFIIGAPGKDGNLASTYALFGGDFTKSINLLGTVGEDVLEGTATGDKILGLAGDDLLIGNGGLDVIYGGVGDDIISVADPYFQRVDGGAGLNTLRLEGYRDQAWDLTTLSPGLRIKNIQVVDMGNYGDNKLTLNKVSVLQMSGDSKNLIVLGDAGDIVNLSSEFLKNGQFNSGGELFNRYTAGHVNVLLSPTIKTSVSFNAPLINTATNLADVVAPQSLLSVGGDGEGISLNPSPASTDVTKSNGQPTRFYVTAEPAVENDEYVTFKVQRGGNVSTRSTVIYQTVNGTAIAGKDYVASMGTLAFDPGEVVKEIRIKQIDDLVYEGNSQSFDLQILPITDSLAQQLTDSQLTVSPEVGNQIRNLERGTLDLTLAADLGVALPLGALNFNVTTFNETTVVEMPLSGVVGLNSYYRLNGQTGQYEEFLYDGETGAEFIDSDGDGNTDTLRLHLKDGDWADNDLTENGVIAGSNAPAKASPGLVSQGNGIFFVPTSSDGQLQFHNLTAGGDYEMGAIAVDDATGRIGNLQPGNPGYTEAALSRKQTIFSNASGSNLQALTSSQAASAFSNPQVLIQSEFKAVGSFTNQQLIGDRHYGLYLTQNGQTQLSIGNDKFQSSHDSRSFAAVGWENSVFEIGTPLLVTPGTPGQQLQATFELARGGAYENTVALYKVDSLTGGLDLNRDGLIDLKPGDAGYAKSALERVQDIQVQDIQTGFVLPKVEDIFTSRSSTLTLDGGALYGMVLIPNASVAELLENNPGNSADKATHGFFSFGQVNPGGNSHVLRLGKNLWGFEDIIGGGDRDYNDAVLQVTFAKV